MTNDFDDHDDLASAYLDGQVTDAEAARIEGDPALLERVAELRAVSEGLDVEATPPVDEVTRRRHLAMAMSAFDDQHGLVDGADQSGSDAVTSTVAEEDDPPAVVDLGARRAQPRAEPERRGRAGLPSWLGVAAALIAVVGGIGFISQLPGIGGDSDDAATEAAADFGESETEESEPATTAVARADSEASTALAESAPAADEDAAGADDASASDGDTMADEEAMEDEAAEESDDATVEQSGGGLFPDEETIEEARRFYTVVPTPGERDELLDGPMLDPALSQCATDGFFDDEVVLGFVPLAIDGAEAELLFLEVGEPATVVVDADCQVLEP